MANITRNPTANTTPNIGGDSPVASPTNTGHGTTSFSGNGSASCRWSGFAAVSGQVLSVRLKADHSSNGFLSGFSSSNSFIIEYSLNGGGSWTTAFSRAFFTTLLNSSIDVALPVNQDVSQVQVRDRGITSIVDPELENAAIDFSMSSIRIEITTQDQTHLLVMM